MLRFYVNFEQKQLLVFAKKPLRRAQKTDSIKSFQKTEYHGYLLRFRESLTTRISMLDLHSNDEYCSAQKCSARAGAANAV